ncbi:MAG: M10 family metallopeptidase C-terminal domain-containing protein, partial [Magnetococcales bacterium]|nr:M10 family metallopeptidase C-terminal domain-containing protein [Magnetococcales bacterium]
MDDIGKIMGPSVEWQVNSDFITYSYFSAGDLLDNYIVEEYAEYDESVRAANPLTKFINPLTLDPRPAQFSIESMLNAWANVADISFMESSSLSEATIRIGTYYSNTNDGFNGYAIPNFGRDPVANDLWINRDGLGSALPGSRSFKTLLHEIGHILGLVDSYAEGQGYSPNVPQDERILNTVMAVKHPDDIFQIDPSVYPQTPMVDDIAAIQLMYGPNMTYQAGNTTWNYAMWGIGHFMYTIWDAKGTDTIDASYLSDKVMIDLRDGHYSSVGFDSWEILNLGIARNAIIENAKGGSGDDKIIGNDKTNELYGGGGADKLYGGGNTDYLFGDDGGDTLYGEAGMDGLEGGEGNDILDGGSGDDYMEGGIGDDVYYIDSSSDAAVEYVSAGVDTVYCYSTGTGYKLNAYVEKLVLSEDYATSGAVGYGNSEDNTLIGRNPFQNILYGEGGQDEIRVENGTNNQLYGGANTDWLYGSDWNDTLNGGEGSDLLVGGTGYDLLIGGTGFDVYVVDDGDVIQDEDRLGAVLINYSFLSGGTGLSGKYYGTAGGLTVTYEWAGGVGNSLYCTVNGQTFAITSFVNQALGIKLIEIFEGSPGGGTSGTNNSGTGGTGTSGSPGGTGGPGGSGTPGDGLDDGGLDGPDGPAVAPGGVAPGGGGTPT